MYKSNTRLDLMIVKSKTKTRQMSDKTKKRLARNICIVDSIDNEFKDQ